MSVEVTAAQATLVSVRALVLVRVFVPASPRKKSRAVDCTTENLCVCCVVPPVEIAHATVSCLPIETATTLILLLPLAVRRKRILFQNCIPVVLNWAMIGWWTDRPDHTRENGRGYGTVLQSYVENCTRTEQPVPYLLVPFGGTNTASLEIRGPLIILLKQPHEQ